MVTSTNTGRAGAWCNQLSLICTLPVLPLRLGIDCQEVKTVPWANGGHKNHVPVSSSSAKGRYQSNSHIYWKQTCLYTPPPPKVFVMSRTLCKASDLHSLCGELFEEKLSLRRSHTLGVGIFWVPISLTNEESHVQHFLAINISP